MRQAAAARLERLLDGRSTELGDDDLEAAAVVFAPHPDDETLGCGGLVARKRALGVPVTIVWATDGAASHAGLLDGAELRRMREEEAVAAAGVLGVERDDLVFLDAPDGGLAAPDARAAAMEAAVEVLRARRPAQVVVPSPREPIDDHAATAGIALEAVRTAGLAVTALEYPVWLWHGWPWTPAPLLRAAGSIRSVRALFACRHHVEVGPVLEQKRAALAQHRTQMERLGSPRWPVLADVGDGELLTRLLGDRERYRRSVIRP